MINKPIEIELWININGKSPVADFIDTYAQRKEFHAQILKKIDHYENLGFESLQRSEVLCVVTQSSNPLLEMKLKLQPPIRILGIREASAFIALHAFEKKYGGAIKQNEIKQGEANFQIYKNQKISYEISRLQKAATVKRHGTK